MEKSLGTRPGCKIRLYYRWTLQHHGHQNGVAEEGLGVVHVRFMWVILGLAFLADMPIPACTREPAHPIIVGIAHICSGGCRLPEYPQSLAPTIAPLSQGLCRQSQPRRSLSLLPVGPLNDSAHSAPPWSASRQNWQHLPLPFAWDVKVTAIQRAIYLRLVGLWVACYQLLE